MAPFLVLLFLVPHALLSDSWERRALFPPGQSPPVYIESNGDETYAIDASGRIIQYHTDSVSIVGFPYRQSCVRKVVPTRKGIFVQYEDGEVYHGNSLLEGFARTSSNIVDITPDRKGYCYMLSEEATVYSLQSGVVATLPVTKSLSIAAFGDTVVVIDSAGIATHLVWQSGSASWQTQNTTELPNASLSPHVVFLDAQTILYTSNSGINAWVVSTGLFVPYLGPDSILAVDTDLSFDARIFVDSSGFCISRAAHEVDFWGHSGRRHLVAHYSDNSRHWTKRLLSTPILGYTIYTRYVRSEKGNVWLTLSNGWLRNLGESGPDTIVQSKRNSEGWSQVGIRGDTAFFLASTLDKDSIGIISGYYIASYSISRDKWIRSFEVSLPSQWPSDVPDILFTEDRSKIHLFVGGRAATIDVEGDTLDTAVSLPVKWSIARAAYVNRRFILALSNCHVFELDTKWNVIRVDSALPELTLGISATISSNGSVAYGTPSAKKSRIEIFYADNRSRLTIEDGEYLASYPPRILDNGNVMIPRLVAYSVADNTYTYHAEIYDRSGSSVELLREVQGPIALYSETNYASADLLFIEQGRRLAVLIFSAADRLIRYSVVPRRSRPQQSGSSDYIGCQYARTKYLIGSDSEEMWLYDRDSATTVKDGGVTHVNKFNVYPNPTSSLLNLDLGSHSQSSPDSISIKITSLLGETVYDNTGEFQDIRNTGAIQIPVGGLSNGIYVVSLTSKAFTHSKVVAVFR